jgi:hypothetical protein
MKKRAAILVLGCVAAGLAPAASQARIWYSGQHASGPYRVELIARGRALPVHHHRGHSYVEGRVGERYEIRIHNRSWRRVEAVISVDGRDAIDGRSASLRKRGYVIPPYSHVDVDGFRLNRSQVAAFRFTTVPDSYSARMGTPWKVGIVGVAIFPERVRRPPPPPPRPPFVLRGERRSGRGSPDDWDAHAGAKAESSAGLAEAPRQRRYRHKNLGTRFGERRASPVSETHFRRQNHSAPAARLSLRYDDRHGLCTIGIGSYCYPDHPPYPPPPPPRPRDQYAEPPPGWDHFTPWY